MILYSIKSLNVSGHWIFFFILSFFSVARVVGLPVLLLAYIWPVYSFKNSTVAVYTQYQTSGLSVSFLVKVLNKIIYKDIMRKLEKLTSRATERGSALERRSPMQVWMSLKISTASFFTLRSEVTIMGFLIGSLLQANMLAIETFLLKRP